MSKTIAKRQIGISRTGNRKHPANWTGGETGMAQARAIRADLHAEIHGGELNDDHGDIDPMMFE